MPRRARAGGETIGGRTYRGGQFIPDSALRGSGSGTASSRNVRIEWFVDQVVGRVEVTMRQRVVLATKFVESRVVQNIARPVTKRTGPRGGRVVTNRSVAGEYPKADTTQLLKTIFSGIQTGGKWIDGFVGTPLDYGLILETQMDRSFLVRTLREEQPRIQRLLTKRIA